MLRALIIDDELNAVKTIQSFLHKYVEGVSVVGIANSKEEAIALMANTTFDLALLDINLGDGTGFQVLESAQETAFDVIFITAYDEHAIKAFKYSALDYLLKPLNPEEFVAAIDRVKARKSKGQKAQIAYASKMVSSGAGSKIVVNSSSEIHFVNISEIIRLESYRNYTDIYLTNNQKITSTKTLKFYENLLIDSPFFRIHQKHLVNTQYIKKFLKEDGGYVLLSDNSKLEVSRRKKEDLLNKLLN